jgi:hypothetical protein
LGSIRERERQSRMGIIQGGGGDLFPPFPLTSIKADLAMQLPGQGLGIRPTAKMGLLLQPDRESTSYLSFLFSNFLRNSTVFVA